MSLSSLPLSHNGKNTGSDLSEHLLAPSTAGGGASSGAGGGVATGSMDMEEQRVFLDEDDANMIRTHNHILPQGAPAATSGERQPSQYRDAGFAVAFLMQLMMVLVLAFYWGIPALTSSSSSSSYSSNTTSHSSSLRSLTSTGSDDTTVPFLGWLYVFLLSGVVALLMSALGLYVMARFAKQLIQICALLHLFVTLVLTIEFLVQGAFAGGAFMFLLFLFGGWYFWSIQRRIHFAASNLVTAAQAIRANLGILLVALAMVIVSLLWTTLWLVAVNGARLKTSHCEEYDSSSKQCISMHYNGLVMALLLLSFFWTHQVILNIVHVTVAGVVATFWFAPEEANSFCSASIKDSWCRASTLSLGSIALGSLLVAFLEWLRLGIQYIRRHGGEGILSCLAEFLVSVLEQLVEYFNKWAFVFVGVYGYSYMESGQKAMELFRQRGWTTIINDQLTYNVLNFLVIAIGLSAACVMVGLISVLSSMVDGLQDTTSSVSMVALIALAIGVLMASVTMRVVASAVDTVIVCFAEAPNDFRRHHPQLHQNMVEAWRLTYPDEFEL